MAFPAFYINEHATKNKITEEATLCHSTNQHAKKSQHFMCCLTTQEHRLAVSAQNLENAIQHKI